MTMPKGWREVRPGLYERVDTPRGAVISLDFIEQFVHAAGGSPAFRELAEQARAETLRAQEQTRGS